MSFGDRTTFREESLAEMTGEQFCWHIQRMMWGLLRLDRKLEALVAERQRVIDQYSSRFSITEAEIRANTLTLEPGDTIEMLEAAARGGFRPIVVALLEVLLKERDYYASMLETIRGQEGYTGIRFGEDWDIVFVEHENVAALAYRMSKMEPALVKAWYEQMATILDLGHSVLETESDYRLRIAQAELHFWERMEALRMAPVTLFEVILQGVAEFAAGVANALGNALGTAAEGLASALWNLFKRALPFVLLAGGVVIGGTYLWRRGKGYVLGRPRRAGVTPPSRRLPPPKEIIDVEPSAAPVGLGWRARRATRRG